MSQPLQTDSKVVPWLVACALFMETLDSTILTTALPAIARSLEEDPLHLSLAITSYLLSLAIFIPLSGWLADRYGARSVFRNAILVFMLGSLSCAASTSLGGLIVARMLQGLGGALMVPVARLVLLRAVPKDQIVAAMAMVTVPALTAPIFGPPLGGLIVAYASWPWIFLINVPIGLLGWWMVSRYVRNEATESPPPLDLAGWWLLGGGLGGLLIGFETLGKRVLPNGMPLMALSVGILLLTLYVRHAREEPWPVLRLSLLAIPTFRASITGGSLFRLGIGAFTLLLPLMLQLGFGYSALTSGTITLASAVGALGMKVVAQKLTRRYGFRPLLLYNTALCSLALALCAAIRPEWPWALLFGFLLLSGFLRSLQFTCINAMAFADVDERDMSQAASFSSTAQQLALSMGVGLASQVLNVSLAIRHGSVLAPIDFSWAFVAAALLSLASLLAFRRLLPNAGDAVSGHRLALADAPQTTAAK